MKKFLQKLKNIFSHHCPECDGIMQIEMLDSQIDKLVYKCEKCGKEWI